MKTIKRVSKYKMGWIGIRASRISGASKLLRRDGWMRVNHAELNNRNGFDWVLPVQTKEKFNFYDWSRLASAGLEGLAFWLSDAQWEKNAGLTDRQWRKRAIIEAPFKAKWPNGRRENNG